jgi:hypothetical protein
LGGETEQRDRGQDEGEPGDGEPLGGTGSGHGGLLATVRAERSAGAGEESANAFSM